MARGSDGKVTLNFEADIRQLQTKLDVINDSIQNMSDQSQQNFKSVGFQVMEFNQALELAQKAVRILKAALSKPIETAAEFEALQQRVENLYGEVERGREAFAAFADQAAKTPFSLQKVVEAGAQLKAFGLNAEETLSSAADLAAFMGVDIVEAANSMGRAFAGGVGAADILRERGVLNLIKEFKGLDDLTQLTLPEFRQAMLDTFVDPSANIAGSADRMAETYRGAVSNMQDSLDQLYNAIGERLLPAMKDSVKNVTSFAQALKNFIELKDDEKIRKEHEEFQILSMVLQDVNTSQVAREEALRRLQKEYPEYLGNIDLEKTSSEDLAEAIKKVNDEFERKIRLTAAQRILTEQYEQVAKAQKEVFEAELEYRRKAQEVDNVETAGGNPMLKDRNAILERYRNNISKANGDLEEQNNKYEKIYNHLIKQGLQITDNGDVTDGITASEEGRAEAVQKVTEEEKLTAAELKKQQQIEEQINRILFNRKTPQQQIKQLESDIAMLKSTGEDISREDYLLLLQKEDQLELIREKYKKIQESAERIEEIQDKLTDKQRDQLGTARLFSDTMSEIAFNAKNTGDILEDSAKRFGQQIASDLIYYLLWLAVTQGAGDFAGGSPIFSLFGRGLKLPGFAEGGSFTVPGGSGGTDSQVVAFKATPGEHVSVSTPEQAGNSDVAQRLDTIIGLLKKGGNFKVKGNDLALMMDEINRRAT